MKIASKVYPTGNASYEAHIKEKTYSFAILENMEDVHIWANINSQVKSKSAADFWFGFNSQNFRTSPLDYMAHEDNTNSMGYLLATQMVFLDKKTSIVDFCEMSDKIIREMYISAAKWVIGGKMARINESGGMCPIDDLSEYTYLDDITPEQLVNWILNKDVNYKLTITSSVLVIENAKSFNRSVIAILKNKYGINEKDTQLINEFKTRTMLFKPVDYYYLFNEGVKNGLHSIVFETSAQDERQIKGLKSVIERVMHSNPNSILTIYARISNHETKKLLKTITDNIKIIFI